MFRFIIDNFINKNDQFYVIEAAVFVIQFSAKVLYNFWVTVKAITLTFISRRVFAISSVQGRKSGSIYFVKSYEVVCAAQTCVHFIKILTIYTLNSHLLTQKRISQKVVCDLL